MTTLTIEINDELAEALRRLAAAQQRSESELVREALALFAQRPPLPKGLGKYRSGQSDVSQNAKDVLRDAVKEGQWP